MKAPGTWYIRVSKRDGSCEEWTSPSLTTEAKAIREARKQAQFSGTGKAEACFSPRGSRLMIPAAVFTEYGDGKVRRVK